MPDRVAENGDIVVPRLHVFGAEAATQMSRHGESIEKLGCHFESVDSLGAIGEAQVETAIGHRAQTGEDAASLPVLIVGHGGGKLMPVALHVLGPDHDHPACIGNRERSERGLNNAVDGRVRADAEGERKHHDHREAGILAQHARAITDVLQETFERRPSPHIASDLLHQTLVAELGQAAKLASSRDWPRSMRSRMAMRRWASTSS